ncbi:MAG: hypothetical protein QOD49_2377 [Actinomycetota bacterium]|nr:hypothetical protein [Actinomycetota bacterium]
MTAPPAGGPEGTEIPRLLSAQFRAASITEFAYLTPRGEPLCWPVTPYWYPERGILGISTGLGYPNKAYYAQRHPRVAALFGSTLLQGDAVVLDDDLQANTDRYVREMRAKFLSARFGLNPLSVRLLDFYLPRLWIEITPVHLLAAVAGGSLGTNPRSAENHRPSMAPGPQLNALLRWVRQATSAVVALAGPDGYPSIARVRVAPGPEGSVELESAPGTGPAALTFHTEGLGGVRLDALMARGRVETSDGIVRFVPRRVVGFLGREPDTRPSFLSIFPLSQFPRAGALRATLWSELSRRGEALPRLRVPR